MAILKVARIGNPVLRRPAEPVPEASIGTPELERLIDDMVETMHEYDGVGVAAPQIHVSLRLAVIEVPADEEDPGVPLTVLINPRLVAKGARRVFGWEGCLSIPDLRGEVPRHERVELAALDRSGQPIEAVATGFYARVLQHECDHLDGRVYIDRMEGMTSLSYLSEFERYVLKDAAGDDSEA